jgi:hypothetical protein
MSDDAIMRQLINNLAGASHPPLPGVVADVDETVLRRLWAPTD